MLLHEIIRIIQKIYQNCCNIILFDKKTLEKFKTKNGLRQAGSLSSTLFNG